MSFPQMLRDYEAMMVILQAGGFKTGGINFDAHIRRIQLTWKIFLLPM